MYYNTLFERHDMPHIIANGVPPVDLPIQETAEQIIQALQKRFADQGYLRGLVLATLEQCVDQEVAVNEKILRTYIMDNWDTFFPGVEESETNTQEAHAFTALALREKKDHIRSRLMEYLMGADSQKHSGFHSLLIPPDEINALLRKPCNGRPHDFAYSQYPTWIRAFVKTRMLHRERTLFKKHCGNGYLFQAGVALEPCKNCNVARIIDSNIRLYCDYCGSCSHRFGDPIGLKIPPTWTTIEAVISSNPQYRILSKQKKEVIKIY